MMKYTAPDGFVIESRPYPEEVTYSLSCTFLPEGRYESIETTGSAKPIGIQQIRILRLVENEIMTITIRESSDQELIDYINGNR